MFFKKKKAVEDYYKNELMRSRMSDISIRTDEIIQQYFFVSKEDTMTLDEYFKIRGLATTELELARRNEKPNTKHKDETTQEGLPIIKEKLPFNKADTPTERHIEPETNETPKGIHTPHEEKVSPESHRGPQNAQEEKPFDFLAMMQEVED